MGNAEIFTLQCVDTKARDWFVRLDGSNDRIYPLGHYLGGYDVALIDASKRDAIIREVGLSTILGTN